MEAQTHSQSDQRLNVSFSNVKYPDIAPFIGPDPLWTLDDNPCLIYQSEFLPTGLFKRHCDGYGCLVDSNMAL